MSRLLSLLALCALPLYADTLTDLRERLTKLSGTQQVEAEITIGLFNADSDKTLNESDLPKLKAQVKDSPGGLQIAWSRDILDQCEKEAISQNQNRDLPTPIRSTVESLRATQAEEYLNASQSFLRKLEKAKLSAESDSTWEGKPARLLSLKLNPSLVEKDKKYIKEFEQTAQIWLDPSTGLPLAATTHVHLKGRAFIVISFEDESNESYRFQTVGDRLIITELRKDGKGSGGGESNTRKSLIKIDIAKS